MNESESSSGVNTVLLVIILVVVVGALVWFFRGGIGQQGNPQDNKDIKVDVKLPAGTGGNSQPAPQGGTTY